MTAARENFFILDPSLTDFRGHHFMLTDIASRSAEAAGMEVVWLASDKAGNEIKRPNVSVEPWFGAGLYDAYRGANDAPPWWRAALAKLGVMTIKKPALADPVITLARDLERAIDAFAGNTRQRFFVHTADGAFYRALALIAPRLAAGNAPVFHVCTPYDPTGVMPNRGAQGELAQALTTLTGAGVIDRTLFLYGENAFLATHLADVWDVRVRSLEIPFTASSNDIANKGRHAFRKKLAAPDDTLVVASLGPARLEKGFHLIPDIVRRCHELVSGGDYPTLDRHSIHFALHAAPQIIGRHPVIAEAVAKLDAQDNNMATLFTEPMPALDYQSLLGAADVVLMPYDADKYRVRGSGVVIEALGAGKIIVATKGSYPARRIADGAGAAAVTPMEFAIAICDIAAARSAYATKAAAAGRAFAAENTLDGYVGKLIASEREGEI